MNDTLRKEIFKEFKDMITTETVVGQPMYIGEATIIPFVDISFGFGTGEREVKGAESTSTGGAGGGKVSPSAVLIMRGERVELFSVKNAAPSSAIDKVLNMVPEVAAHFSKKKEKRAQVREAAIKEARAAIKEEAETGASEEK